MQFSVIIPIYNRPDEIVELLESLTLQSAKSAFEVIIIEDGSAFPCKEVIEPYFNQLNLHYYTQENKGPGPARNHGASKAIGEYLIFFDSDCIIPSNYFNHIIEHLDIQPLECFGGPDESHPFFTPIQKAISYSMTSPVTTGGIRGGSRKMDKFYPRSFNLGIKKEIFESISGFADMRFGEDLDLSMRTMDKGYSVGLIKEAYVYHKRRTHFKAFFKQVFNSGIARIDLSLLHPGTLKPVHLLPSAFTIGYPLLLIMTIWLSSWFLIPFLLFPAIIFTDAFVRTKSFYVALLSTWASLTQLTGYGTGFLKAFWVRIVKKKGAFHNFAKSFYD
ncbi:glycosyltransferase [Carboxylicivirga marina]|uniref:Glycosyltransferase n=1 Tax=Carboxylicivirga marina TaxID=2800988 RepID=A0ABS1HMU8_9BACT|nr:glycosyltransferase [Carboxylicivirga marina]MBK3518991.1 glycosyltransferase [Carboxylicivirga marina]